MVPLCGDRTASHQALPVGTTPYSPWARVVDRSPSQPAPVKVAASAGRAPSVDSNRSETSTDSDTIASPAPASSPEVRAARRSSRPTTRPTSRYGIQVATG